MIISLQFLRYIAAALVVLNHSIGEFKGSVGFGAFGVDIFFVLSGFIISHISESEKSGFFIRRIIRIVPQYWLFTIGLAFVAYVAPGFLRSAFFDVTHIASSLLFFPYWTPSTGFSPLLKLGWTLNYEMFFYLLFWLSMRINYPQREFVCSVLLLSVVAVVQIANFPSQSFIFFYGKDIVLEFILGMALAVWYRNRFRFREKVDHWVYFIFAGALLVLLKEPGEIVDLRFFYWGLPAAVVVFCFLHFEAAFRKAPQGLKKGFLLGGELSYPLYLIHPYFIVFFSRVLNAKEFGAFFLFSISLLGASVASYMVLVFYDKPLRARLSGLCLGDSGRH